MTDLVSRLREEAATFGVEQVPHRLLTEAADRVEALEKQLEAEREERAVRARALTSTLQELERLRAELERMRRVVVAAQQWRECDTSQSADRGFACGCLDRLADAVDALTAADGGRGEPA